MSAPALRHDVPGGDAWREHLLTRMGWVLFFAGAPVVAYRAFTVDLGTLAWVPGMLPPLVGALTAALARRWSLAVRCILLVTVLLIGGASFAWLTGPSPGIVAYLTLAAVLAAFVVGGP